MEKDWLSIWKKNQLEKVLQTNEMTEKYGLSLREEDAILLLEERSFSLKEQKRVEFSGGITEKLIYEFCDCPYLDQSSYVETMIRLQEIFYLYKNGITDSDCRKTGRKIYRWGKYIHFL